MLKSCAVICCAWVLSCCAVGLQVLSGSSGSDEEDGWEQADEDDDEMRRSGEVRHSYTVLLHDGSANGRATTKSMLRRLGHVAVMRLRIPGLKVGLELVQHCIKLCCECCLSPCCL